MTAEDLSAVSHFDDSPLFSEREKAALAYAEEVSRTPVRVSAELFERLKSHFNEEQIVELTASIAYENYRARFNHALDIKSEQFYE
ncbi:MAG TPA: hypothetical protein VF754_10720 [Pyrinomonadaceae bacterium]